MRLKILLTLFIKPRLATDRLKRLSLFLIIMACTACGQMGPLYLPIDETASDTSTATTTTEY